MTQKVKEELIKQGIIDSADNLSDDDLLDLIMLETMKLNRETSEKLTDIRKTAIFFRIIGIISVVCGALYLYSILLNWITTIAK